MASPRCPRSSSCSSAAQYDLKTFSTWPLDGIVSPNSQRDYPASPRRVRRTRRRSVPENDCVVRWRSAPDGKKGRLNPSVSPSMRASPIAIGAGRAAVGFLRGCINDVSKDTPEAVSWGCFNRFDKVCEVGDSEDIDITTPISFNIDSSSTVFGEKDIIAPTMPANALERPCRARLRRRALMSFLNIKEENERCSCCNKDEYWVCFDIFCAMDRNKDGAVRRGDFVWALSAHGASVEFQRVIRRARLSAYFKSTAREISFEEFSQRIFPNASPIDSQKMRRWICLRKAHRILASEEFKAQEEELREVFMLLEEDLGCGTVHLADLVRAQILSKEEILDIVPFAQGPHMSYEEFCAVLSPSLVRKYTSEDMRTRYMDYESQVNWEESIASKLEAIHHAVLSKSPKSLAISKCSPLANSHRPETQQLLLYSTSVNRSPRSQQCRTDSKQSPISDMKLAMISAF